MPKRTFGTWISDNIKVIVVVSMAVLGAGGGFYLTVYDNTNDIAALKQGAVP